MDVYAKYSVVYYQITATAGANGSVEPEEGTGTIEGPPLTITITPNTGYEIDIVTVNGEEVSVVIENGVGTHTFTSVTEEQVLVATFKKKTYTISTSAGENGTISGGATVEHGDNFEVTITPNEGYYISSIAVSDGTIVDVSGNWGETVTHTFEDIDENKTISVEFAIKTFEIQPATTGNGTISSNPEDLTNVEYGSEIELTFTPATGHYVKEIVVDGSKVFETNNQETVERTYSLTVTQAHEISVVFGTQTFEIETTTQGNGTISGETTVEYNSSTALTITPEDGYYISGIFVGESETSEEFELNQDGTYVYTFSNVVENKTIKVVFEEISIIVEEAENGTILSDPEDLSNIKYGDEIEFTFEPATGHYVKEIVVDGTKVYEAIDEDGSTKTYLLTAKNVHSVEVVFEPTTHTISVSYTGNGTIDPNGAVEGKKFGTNLYLTFYPDEGYFVKQILVDGEKVSLTTSNQYYSTYTLNVQGDHNVFVTFDKITLTAETTTNGTISTNPADLTNLVYGDEIEIVFTPETGYYISSITVDGRNIEVTAGYGETQSHTLTVFKQHEVTATFEIQKFEVATATTGNGTINFSTIQNGEVVGGKYTYGSNVSFDITPNEGYYISSITVSDGTIVDVSGNWGETVQVQIEEIKEAKEIEVVFAIKTFEIEKTIEGNGTVSGETTVEYGSLAELTIAPENGYFISGIFVGESETSEEFELNEDGTYVYTFSNVIENKTIKVVFEEIEVTITQSENGTITIEDLTNAKYGDEVQITFTPNDGYYVGTIWIDGEIANGEVVALSTVETYTLKLTGKHTVTCEFTATQCSIEVIQAENGTIVPEGTFDVSFDDERSFTFTPNDGYYVKEILIDGEIVVPETVNGKVQTFTLKVSKNHKVSAVFEKISVEIESVENGTISTTTDLNTLVFGQEIEFEIIPEIGYYITSITVDGTKVYEATEQDVNNKTYTVTASSTHSISATFAIQTFEISTFAGENGTITETTMVNWGTDFTVVMDPNSGYYISSITIDGTTYTVSDAFITALNGASQEYTFTNVQEAHSISVVFETRNAYFNNTESGGIVYRSEVALPATLSLGKTVNGRTWNSISGFPTGKTININLTEALSSAVALPFDKQSYAWYKSSNLVETIQATGTYTYKALPTGTLSGTFQKHYLGLTDGFINGEYESESWTGDMIVPTSASNSANPFTTVSSNFEVHVTQFAFEDKYGSRSEGGTSATIYVKYAGSNKGTIQVELTKLADGYPAERIRTATGTFNLTSHVQVKVTLECGQYQSDLDGDGPLKKGPRVTVKVQVIAINR